MSAEGFSLGEVLHAPKGHKMAAQGEALGREGRSHFYQFLSSEGA